MGANALPPLASRGDDANVSRAPILAPLLVIAGAVVLSITAGSEILAGVRVWLAGEGALPEGLILHTLVAGAALLLAAAVLMTRRSVRATEAAEAALRESEERMRLVANNVPALISYLDREQRYRFSNRTYDDWFGIEHERMLGRTVAEVFGEEAEWPATFATRLKVCNLFPAI